MGDVVMDEFEKSGLELTDRDKRLINKAAHNAGVSVAAIIRVLVNFKRKHQLTEDLKLAMEFFPKMKDPVKLKEERYHQNRYVKKYSQKSKW